MDCYGDKVFGKLYGNLKMGNSVLETAIYCDAYVMRRPHEYECAGRFSHTAWELGRNGYRAMCEVK